jgi:hypothetical protein
MSMDFEAEMRVAMAGVALCGGFASAFGAFASNESE